MICGESCRLGRGRRLSKILSADSLGIFFIRVGLRCKSQNASHSQFREVRERVRARVLTSASVVFCPIRYSICLLSCSSTADRSCLLPTSTKDRDEFVELLMDPELV